jgi:hypothetical protein
MKKEEKAVTILQPDRNSRVYGPESLPTAEKESVAQLIHPSLFSLLKQPAAIDYSSTPAPLP